MTPPASVRPRRKRELWFERYVHDVSGHNSSGYTSERSLREVFEQTGSEVIKIGPNRFLVIEPHEVLIYSFPVRAKVANA